MARHFDEMNYAGDLAQIEEGVEKEHGGGVRPRLEGRLNQVQRQGNRLRVAMRWDKSAAGKRTRGDCQVTIEKGKIVYLSGDIPYGGIRAAGGVGGAVRAGTKTMKAGGGFDVSQARAVGPHDPNADFTIFAWGTGGGEIFTHGPPALRVSDEDFDDMKTAPAGGYSQMIDFDRGVAFWVKTKEGHYAKIQVLNVRGQSIQLKVVYRPDGQRVLGQ